MSQPNRRRGLVIAAIVVAVLAVGAVAVDAWARGTVESSASEALASEVTSPQPLEVSIEGWPFLSFLVTDRIESVHITGTDVTLTRDGRSVTLASVDVTATGVENPRTPSEATVETIDAVGVVSWADISREAGFEVGFGGDDRLRATETITILGQDLEAVFSAVPGIDEPSQQVTLTDPEAGLGPLTTTAGLLDTLVDRLAASLVLPPLEGMTYQSARATEAGLEVTVTGEDVSVAELR